MLNIFGNMVERIMEVFMDDLIVHGKNFDECLPNLKKVLERCIVKDQVLNWEKCYVMMTSGVVLGHIISREDIQVNPTKIKLISNLHSTTIVIEVTQFLGHASFYRRFIQDFLKIFWSLFALLLKDVKFI